jgi:hypothetical protein
MSQDTAIDPTAPPVATGCVACLAEDGFHSAGLDVGIALGGEA